MPNTRPGIKFVDDICSPCINYEKQKATDWNSRKKEFEKICDKHRGSNGNSYDCAIAISGGKDSHFQVYYMKEVMKMNPLLLSVGNIDWTETGRDNLNNISARFQSSSVSISNAPLASISAASKVIVSTISLGASKNTLEDIAVPACLYLKNAILPLTPQSIPPFCISAELSEPLPTVIV